MMYYFIFLSTYATYGTHSTRMLVQKCRNKCDQNFKINKLRIDARQTRPIKGDKRDAQSLCNSLARY